MDPLPMLKEGCYRQKKQITQILRFYLPTNLGRPVMSVGLSNAHFGQWA
jgi:hypothetical protein